MKAILLAGGQGRRLRSITGSLPKPMVPLVGVPGPDPPARCATCSQPLRTSERKTPKRA